MDHTHHGLPWPEAYQALHALIEKQWGIDDEIYLTRQLSGGRSGAMVYLADVTGRDFAGLAVLKLDQASDPGLQEKSEAERHMQAAEASPDFAEKHLLAILHTAHDGESLAILSTVAGRGLEYAEPWAVCDHHRQLGIVKRLSRALLEDWNRNAKLAAGLQSPQTLLRSWLGYRLDPEQGRLYRMLPELCAISPEEPSFSFDGQWYPNPFAFAVTESEAVKSLKLRAVIGHVHGDLNGFNVLVSKTGAEKDMYYLIDLALYEPRQFLFYDHGYFALSYLLSTRGQAAASHWRSILNALCPFDHIRVNTSVSGDDVGVIGLLKLLREEAFNWVDRYQTHRLSYMESQFQLAQVAVGLNFANKQIDDDLRRKAVLYAASVLKNYLLLHNVDWPRHGPPFLFEGPAQSPSPVLAAERSGQTMTNAPQTFSTPPEKPSIAVRTFDNRSGDPEQDYFAHGITDEITLELSRIDWLTVISAGPAPVGPGREPGVHYVLEGSVRKSGARLRVTARLVDTEVEEQLWAERYDRQVDDLFEIQEDIAAAIVASIDARLKIAEREQARRKVGNVTVWEAFQKAMWHFGKLTEEDAAIAEAKIADLVERAPTFAGGHAAFALLRLRRLFRGDPEGIDQLLADAFRHATRAVELDEGSSLARIALSRVYGFQGKYEQAVEEAEMSISLNPSSSAGYLNLAITLLWGGRAEEAMAMIDKSIRFSPNGPMLRLQTLVKGMLGYFLDDYGEAERQAVAAEASHILAPFARLFLAAIYLRQQRRAEARNAIAEVSAIRPQLSVSRLRTAWRTMSPRFRDRLFADLEQAGLPD